MAYANAHVKVTIFGTMCDGGEEWSTGFHMGQEDPAGGNFGIGEGFPQALLPLWETFFKSATAGFSINTKTVGIKCALLMPDGKTDLANVVTASYASPIAGQKAGSLFPPQISLVAQLAAASPVGLASKGRMYLPGITHTVNTNGHISVTEGTNVATGLATFLDGAENAVNSPGYVMNVSKGRVGVPFTAPVNKRVTSVKVGSVYDTQRRRRNGLREIYWAAPLAA